MRLVGTMVTMTMIVVPMRIVCIMTVAVVRMHLRLGIGMGAVVMGVHVMCMRIAEAFLCRGRSETAGGSCRSW